MSDKSRIEWTDAIWNPMTGCTRVSEGCQYESIRFRPNGFRYRATADALDQEDGYSAPGMTSMLRVGKRATGRELDGRTWDVWPTPAALPPQGPQDDLTQIVNQSPREGRQS